MYKNRHILTLFVVCLLLMPAMAMAESRGVAASPKEICPLPIGSQFPSLDLQNLKGKNFDLDKAIAEKPTVLIYFRGGW